MLSYNHKIRDDPVLTGEKERRKKSVYVCVTLLVASRRRPLA